MKFLGIDLSLRSTGLFLLSESDFYYKLITSNTNINDEELLEYNWNHIENFINKHNPTHIAIEGLSFNSISSSKDLIAGNFWYIRTEIFKLKKNIILDIVPVKSWRDPLFTKEERKEQKSNEKKVKELKKEIKPLPKADKTKILLENEDLIKHGNIKYLTWEKLPEPIKSKLEKIGFTKGCFDLTDAYYIAKHISKKYLQ